MFGKTFALWPWDWHYKSTGQWQRIWSSEWWLTGKQSSTFITSTIICIGLYMYVNTCIYVYMYYVLCMCMFSLPPSLSPSLPPSLPPTLPPSLPPCLHSSLSPSVQCINRMIGKGSQPTLSMVAKTSIFTHLPLEKYIPPILAHREKLKTKGRHNSSSPSLGSLSHESYDVHTRQCTATFNCLV